MASKSQPGIDPAPLTNPYYGVPPRGGGYIRNPDNPSDFLPNTQVVVRGGFAPILKDVPDGDPDPKFLGPHYPPKGNDFYELTSDGKLSEVYYENARIRKFRANPGMSMLASGLSPVASDAGDETAAVASIVHEDRIYIGQGYWRRANEKPSPMQENKPYRHKYTQEPTKIEAPNQEQAWCREPRANDEFWRASEIMDSGNASQERKKDRSTHQGVPHITKQEGSQSSPRRDPQHDIHRSAENDNKGGEEPKRTQSEANIQKGKDLYLFERVMVEHTTRHARRDSKQNEQMQSRDDDIYSVRSSVSKDQVISSVRPLQQEVSTEEFPRYASYDASSPGDLYGSSSRMAQTKSAPESSSVPSGEITTTKKDDTSRVMDNSDSGRS